MAHGAEPRMLVTDNGAPRYRLVVLERVDQVARLRAELEVGIRQLDAGLGEPLDIEEIIATAHANYGRKR